MCIAPSIGKGDEMKRKRLKFALKILFDRRFRERLVDTICYASGVCGRARGEGTSWVILFDAEYGDIREIVAHKRKRYGELLEI